MRAIPRDSGGVERSEGRSWRGVLAASRSWLQRFSFAARDEKERRRDRLLKRLDRRSAEVAEQLARIEASLTKRVEHTEELVDGLRTRLGEVADELRAGRSDRDREVTTELERVTAGLARLRKTRHREAHRVDPDLAIPSLAAAVELHLTWVDQPLVLISQVQRSGGTLLSQLFDSHPECHTYAYELLVGDGDKGAWPELDLAAGADRWFDDLASASTARNFEEGFVKHGPGREDDLDERRPFLLPPWLQRELFARCARKRRPRNRRGVFDAYFTSYFNAWLDNRCREGEKRAVVGFRPVLAAHPESVRQFFADYPDGHLVSVVRHPASWWTSAQRHKAWSFGSLEEGLSLWRASTEASLENRRVHGERVHLLRYESLVGATERTMRRLAGELGLSWSDRLLEPSFNGWPVQANSSFAVDRCGVLEEPARRHLEMLDPAELAAIERAVGDLYRDAENAIANEIG
jgi:hypothetical protein